jgi:cell wall-associated NlpC family hydrolase
MMSQVLFGERYSVIDRSGSWIKVMTGFDNYSGWIDLEHLIFTPDEEGGTGSVLNRSLLCYKSDGTKLVLEAGCEVFNPDFTGKSFTAGRNIYKTSEDFSSHYVTSSEAPAETAMKFINSPFIWGGRIPSGIDCSGLTQLAYKIAGISIPRDAAAQAEDGTPVDFIDEAMPGDLAFFGNERGRILHVGMFISRSLLIHASGRVRIDPVDHLGIFRKETNSYCCNLRRIRRILQHS